MWRLTRLDILPVGKVTGIRDDALTRKEPVFTWAATEGVARTHAEGADAVGVPEGDDAEAGEHGDAGVRALDLAHEAADGGEDVLFVDAELARLLEVVGESKKTKSLSNFSP